MNLKYNKLEQNREHWNDWADNEKISIEINKILIFDVSEMDNGKYNASEMDNRMCNDSKMYNRRFNAIRGVVRFIKAQITSVWSVRH